MASAAPTGQFEVGGVFRRMASGISANWKVLVGVALGVGIVSSVITSLSISRALPSFDPANPGTMLSIFSSPFYWLTIAGSTLLRSFALSAMLGTLLKSGREGEANFVAAMTIGIRNVLPMIGLTILWGFGLMLGYILLFVPALILLTMWSVSAPALVAERTGVIDAFGRSRALTKGIRWPVFGALLIFGVGYIIFLTFAIQGFSGTALLTLYKSNVAAAIALALLSSSLLSVLLSAFLAGLYGEILEAKEGASDTQLAEVFA